MRKLNNTGDTMVEVLIATVIIGVILVGGYVTSNYQLSVNRQSEDRSIVTQLEKAQIERLQAMVNAQNPAFYDSATQQYLVPTNFCIDSSLNLISNSNNCNFASDGSQNNTQNSLYLYHIYIQASQTPALGGASGTANAQVTATWAKAGGGGNDSETWFYRFNEQASTVFNVPS